MVKNSVVAFSSLIRIAGLNSFEQTGDKIAFRSPLGATELGLVARSSIGVVERLQLRITVTDTVNGAEADPAEAIGI
jgi:hypothetical protein